MALSFPKGQTLVREEGRTMCGHHRRTTLNFFCEKCSEVICANCISTLHKGHDIVQLSEVTQGNKNKIKTFINEMEKKDLIQIQSEIESVQGDLKKYLHHFESVEKEVEDQGKRLKQDVDISIAQTLSELKHFRDENTKLITDYMEELETKLGELKEYVEQCKLSLQTGTDIQVLDITYRLPTMTRLPTKPVFGTAKFVPDENLSLKAELGKMTLTSYPQEIPDEESLESRSIHSFQSTEEPTLPVEDLHIEPECMTSQVDVVSEWEPPCNISSICPSVGGAWTCGISSNIITDLTNQGEIFQYIQSRVRVTAICVSPTTRNLWACSNKDNSVMELTSDNCLTRRFSTKNTPLCLTVTTDNHILVGSKNRITGYTCTGEQSYATKTSLFGREKVCSPWRMSQCPVSNNVAVVDGDWSDDGGKDKPLVRVMNNKLQEMHRYGRSHHIGRQGLYPFDPYDLTYDSFGQLVIADYNNTCIHLLNGEGIYLRLLYTANNRPQTLCVDGGLLWVGLGDDTIVTKEVKLLQYRRE
ncbi:uncharacterized protein LOC132546007 [Ylistrum balloti]|uniref:uncharacterized protein LOC132546007 n=1 Tax=Ylistrum balloti TaxID=509963 RepID=UPI002905B4C2|nr:uncharacterized protein LOC132546007 [Ylistrum balloti]